jgi:hypothetical protein
MNTMYCWSVIFARGEQGAGDLAHDIAGLAGSVRGGGMDAFGKIFAAGMIGPAQG